MQTATKRIVLTMVALSVLAPAAHVFAGEDVREHREAKFDAHHPRRSEVNDRMVHQRRMLKADLKSGKITQQQYNDQTAALKNAKQQEVADVKANGGYITKDQQKAINQELTQTREATRDDVQGNKTPMPPTPAPGTAQ